MEQRLRLDVEGYLSGRWRFGRRAGEHYQAEMLAVDTKLCTADELALAAQLLLNLILFHLSLSLLHALLYGLLRKALLIGTVNGISHIVVVLHTK